MTQILSEPGMVTDPFYVVVVVVRGCLCYVVCMQLRKAAEGSIFQLAMED